ncbi:serine hydrolase domain-containing protein [Edaphocola aurantiacus]|uniref:serine hydrolase domain-containing protein n=1 Tax=Edaphocola aurantiacus TaxID=2601682 RepID=UPI001C97D687|nr:serine hydrolase domain-containing protein [Edaphocola aurantiacus]
MKTYIVPLSLVLCSFTASAQKLHKLDRYIDHIESFNQGVGAISVFKDGKQLYQRRFGQSALPHSKWNKHTQYQIGSITKVYTAVLIWKLIEAGQLTLDTRLDKYMPQMDNADKITIRHLLEHSSGINRDYDHKPDCTNWLIDSTAKHDEIIAEIIRQGVVFEPGTAVAYSNSAYYLLKYIIEQEYGASYGQIVSKKLSKPYHLIDFATADMDPENVFPSYQYDYSRSTWTRMPDYQYRNIMGVGDISTTPAQLNTFFHLLFSGKVLQPESLQQMFPTAKEDFGRNLMSIPVYKQMLYGHAGDTKGTHSLVMYDTTSKIGIAMVLNGQRYPHNQFYIDAYQALFSDSTALPYFVQDTQLGQYTGLYTNDSVQLQLKLYIDQEHGLLCEDVAEELAYPLTPVATNTFKVPKLGITIAIKENELLFTQNGINITLKK